MTGRLLALRPVRERVQQRTADRAAARMLADQLLELSELVRSGRVPSWAVLNVAPSVRMVAHVLRESSRERR